MKILQVELLTADLKSTENFYSNKLALKLFRKDEHSISYIAGHSLLTFKLMNNLQPVYHIAFEIPANKLNEAIEWCNNRIELITFEDNSIIVDFENWNAKSIYFYDDNQNILELIARYDNNIECAESFNATSILNISEVGLVNDNVSQLAQELTTLYELKHYEKQPPRANFCAMGNSEGLFVISDSDRNWFPTERQAVRYPVYVKFEENSKLFELNY